MGHRRLASLGLACLLPCAAAKGQRTPVKSSGDPPAVPALASVSPGIWRLEGDDPNSGIHYVRIFLESAGDSQPSTRGSQDQTTPDLNQPTLTGQCTRDAQGKLSFELFANFGAVSDPAFYPPWRPTANDPFPPSTPKVMLTLEFLGYTRVKPFKRQFERVSAPGPEQLRYLNPGRGSSNLEPPGWFFQYLRALPTLRLSGGTHSAEFPATQWLAELHKEPICAGSGA